MRMRRNQIGVFIHCVWSTWDRLPLLENDIERVAYRSIEAKCQELGSKVLALGGIEDHVHLLVEMPATISVAHLIKEVKGTSAHLIAHKLNPEKFFRWRGSYGAFSVSLSHLDAVVAYIAWQKEHHHSGSLIAYWELPTEEGELHE